MDKKVEEILIKLGINSFDIKELEENYSALELVDPKRVGENIFTALNLGLTKDELNEAVLTNANFLFYSPLELSNILKYSTDKLETLKNL